MPATPAARQYTLDLTCAPADARRAIALAVEEWGASLEAHGDPRWQRDAAEVLRLPVIAGLRRGVLTGPLAVTPAGRSTAATAGATGSASGSRVTFQVEAEEFHLETAAVVVLALGAAGALMGVLWPFFPALLPAGAAGTTLAIAGWFLVVSRRSRRGVDDFLAGVVTLAAASGEPDDEEFSPPPTVV